MRSSNLFILWVASLKCKCIEIQFDVVNLIDQCCTIEVVNMFKMMIIDVRSSKEVSIKVDWNKIGIVLQ